MKLTDLKFQFLIGRLDTLKTGIVWAATARFQFLIGRLDTELIAIRPRAASLFQFLIGRLDTGNCPAVQEYEG